MTNIKIKGIKGTCTITSSNSWRDVAINNQNRIIEIDMPVDITSELSGNTQNFGESTVTVNGEAWHGEAVLIISTDVPKIQLIVR